MPVDLGFSDQPRAIAYRSSLEGIGGVAQVDHEFEGAALRAARDDGAE